MNLWLKNINAAIYQNKFSVTTEVESCLKSYHENTWNELSVLIAHTGKVAHSWGKKKKRKRDALIPARTWQHFQPKSIFVLRLCIGWGCSSIIFLWLWHPFLPMDNSDAQAKAVCIWACPPHRVWIACHNDSISVIWKLQNDLWGKQVRLCSFLGQNVTMILCQ